MGATLAVVAAGCAAGGDASPTVSSSTTRPGQGLRHTLVALFDAPSGVVVSGIEQRLTWAVGDRDGVLAADQPERLVFEFEIDGQRLGPVDAVLRGTGMQQPFLTTSVAFPRRGLATVSVTINDEVLVAEIEVVAPGSSDIPGPGDHIPRVVTPTVADSLGVRPLCSRVPRCPFHESTLADALAAPEPVALLIATPGFCESTLCPPALDLLVTAAPDAPHVTFVHAELYVDPESADALAVAERTEAVHQYGLTFEPSLFLASSAGVVVQRLDNIFDADELVDALDALA